MVICMHLHSFSPRKHVNLASTFIPSLGKKVSEKLAYQRLYIFPMETLSSHLQHEDIKQQELLIFREICHGKEDILRMIQTHVSSQ